MEAQIDQAIASANYFSLSNIFSSTYQTLGQGEQRTLSAYFIKAAQESPSFLPNAFHSPQILSIMKQTLNHLPPTVENALDNKLRYMLFTFLTDELEDYRNAAIILSGIRMADEDHNDQSNVYYISNADRTDVYVKIAECFLNEEDYVEAETFVTKAGTSVESIDNAGDHMTLILRFKSVYARVLDANRKFLQAAGRYYDLSQVVVMSNGEDGDQQEGMNIIDNDDLLEFLGRAATCAILAPSSAQRQRILGQVCKDERLFQLDSMSHFKSHSSIVTKMYKNQIILRNQDWIIFEQSLSDHQKAIMSDGLTIVQRALIEHNMVAVSRLYTSIYFTDLGQLLGVSSDRAEKIACTMIMNGNLVNGMIDEVDGVLNFDDSELEMIHWDGAITNFCSQLNNVTDMIRQFT
jgi:COP9 signalosome complex subunit 4